MKRSGIFIFCLFLVNFSFSQIDSADYKDHSLYLYKTEDDFFNKNKVYRGQITESENKNVIKYTAGSKKKVLNLEDSCSYYYGYEYGGEIQIRPDKKSSSPVYYSFGGGTKDYYCVVYGHLGNYDKKGYLLGLTTPTGLYQIYFVDRVNKLYMVQITDFLKSSPKLFEQFKSERAKISKETWQRKNLEVSIKYLKLFIAEHTK